MTEMLHTDVDLISFDLTCEEYREYDFSGRIYRIESPSTLYMRKSPDCRTHRVVDASGVAHCVPAPGRLGCVLRWKNKNSAKPVNF